jgi:hypothetical protein
MGQQMTEQQEQTVRRMAEETAGGIPMPAPGEVGPSRGLMQFIEHSFKANGDPSAPGIVQSLSAVMADVRAVGKTGHNKQSDYNFRGIDAVVNAVGPAFRAHSIVCTPKLLSHTGSTVTVGRNASVMQWVTIVVRYRFHGPAGDHLDAVVPGEAMDSGDKAMAKAMSVAYRTALLQVLTLPTDEPDPDESTYQRSAEQPAQPPADPTPADMARAARARLLEVCTVAGVTPAQAVQQFAEMNSGADLRSTEDHYAVDRFTQWMHQEWDEAQRVAAGDPA